MEDSKFNHTHEWLSDNNIKTDKSCLYLHSTVIKENSVSLPATKIETSSSFVVKMSWMIL